jgi:rubredoxin
MSHTCPTCRKRFGTPRSLQQHLNSPVHASRYECEECGRVFRSDTALQQHLHSPVHASRYECEECGRVFLSDAALQQHLHSPRHRAHSPLDQFFLSFTDFDYDPLAAPSDEFDRLRSFYGWDRRDADGDEAWSRYMNALVLEFNSWYGTDSQNLRSW